jgi:ribosomal protein S18 acetylase RimI-like enzyme
VVPDEGLQRATEARRDIHIQRRQAIMTPQVATPVELRAATAEDAAIIAQYLHDADPELAAREWRHWTRPGESLLSAAERQCAAEHTDFSFRNASLATSTGRVIGLLQTIAIWPHDVPGAQAIDAPNAGSRASELSHLPNSVHLLTMYVDPAYRRQGAAMRLMRQAETRAIDFGFQTTTLFIRADNQSALPLHRRLGYVEYGRAAVAIGDDPQATVQFLSLRKHIDAPGRAGASFGQSPPPA